jgi:D-cysteine desulfhydrase
VKRDDLDAVEYGGNKVRALEFLLGDVREGDTVLTLGGEGSTHVLATAAHARRLGAGVVAVRWPHEMTPLAHRVARRAEELATRIVHAGSVPEALMRVALLRWRAGRARRRGAPRTHYVPIGGSTPLGVLGHVESGLEIAAQVAAGLLPAPARIVVPLGSGGTAAGIALGVAIAGLDTTVVGARVGPRLAATRGRTMRLAAAAARLIERSAGVVVAPPRLGRVTVDHGVYGGAYGRPLAAGAEATTLLRESCGLSLDATYSAKAAAAALRIARSTEGPTLFWLTFDARKL